MSKLSLTLAMLIGFFATTLGSALVFLFKNEIKERTQTLFLGFASGIMVAASVWSLIIPAIEQSEHLGKLSFLPASIGFLLGGLFLILIDHIVPHIHKNGEEEGPRSTLKKTTRLFLAVTIHNIPEGLAVGFALGAAASLNPTVSFYAALGLAIGIAIQNFPEGAAVSLPMRSGMSRTKAFLYGSFSGAVEPVAALIGFVLANHIALLQPYLLSFSAGAMIFVVAEDLIPDSKLEEHPHAGAISTMLGFVVMMILDVALG